MAAAGTNVPVQNPAYRPARHHHRPAPAPLAGLAVLTVLAVLAAGCGGTDSASGERSTADAAEAADATEARDEPVVLEPEQPATAEELDTSARIIEDRLDRAGVAGADVRVDADHLAAVAPDGIEPALLQAVASRGALAFRPVWAFMPDEPLVSCERPAEPSDPQEQVSLPTLAGAPGDPEGCYVLDPIVLGGDAVEAATASLQPEFGGWIVNVRFEDGAFQPIAEEYVDQQLAIVVDDVVISAPTINPGIIGEEAQISGAFDEGAARGLAAALAGGEVLPVSFRAPPVPGATTTTLPEGERPLANYDHWHVALGVNVCGEWLPDPPEFYSRSLDSDIVAGLHSHGDGLVHIHPYGDFEAGANATLGLFLEYGGWEAGADMLSLWDGVDHRSGDACPDGREAQVRWSVDGEEQTGDPSASWLRDGQVVVLALLPAGDALGTPPQAAALEEPIDDPTASG